MHVFMQSVQDVYNKTEIKDAAYTQPKYKISITMARIKE